MKCMWYGDTCVGVPLLHIVEGLGGEGNILHFLECPKGQLIAMSMDSYEGLMFIPPWLQKFADKYLTHIF